MRITVTASDDIGLNDFYHWLTEDRIGRTATIERADSGERLGRQGVLDQVLVWLPQVVAVADLAIAYAGWRRSGAAPRTTSITFRRGDAEITVETADQATIELIIATLEGGMPRSLGDGGPDGDTPGEADPQP